MCTNSRPSPKIKLAQRGITRELLGVPDDQATAGTAGSGIPQLDEPFNLCWRYIEMNARELSTKSICRWIPALLIVAYLMMPVFSLAASATMPMKFAMYWLHPNDPEEGFGG